MVRSLGWLLAALALRAPGAGAQPPQHDAPHQNPPRNEGQRVLETLFPETADPNDPLSTGALGGLRDVPPPPPPPTPAEQPPVPPGVTPEPGAVLTAIPGVRETSHVVDVALRRDGLAVVEMELRFASTSRYAAELRYRLPVPPGAAPLSLAVCAGDDGPCREAAPGDGAAYHAAVVARPRDGAPAPVAMLRPEPGAFVLRAAPLLPRGALRLRLRYVMATTQHGGVVRVALPPRPSDLRVVPAIVRLRAEGLLAPALQGAPAAVPVEVDPWRAIEGAAVVPSGGLLTLAQRQPGGTARV
ncbi:MAG: hypothetical protein AAF447_24750, partial [Myxococcota bacterium]